MQYIKDLAAKEVIALGSPLAVSAKSRVESRTNCVPKESPEVKLWGQLHNRFFLLLSCEISSVYQCIEDFWEGRPQIKLCGASHCVYSSGRHDFQKNLFGTRRRGG